jgi:hypothetical protein
MNAPESAVPPGAAAQRWGWMSIIAALLLTGYLGFAMWALLSPSDDPQRGMAIGFIMFVAMILLGLLALLWYGVRHGRKWLVRTVFGIAILPGLSPVARVIYLLIQRIQGAS